MFGALFKQNKQEVRNRDAAQHLYESALQSVRSPVFYTEYEVPDSFDGRFDLLLIHLFIILQRLQGREDYQQISQDVFDVTFKNMDQTLREMGIGDMGIPKHMKRMMKAFNGRMHSYQAAIDPSKLDGIDLEGLKITSLEDALRRNLYGTVMDEVSDAAVKKMEDYIRLNLEHKSIGNTPERLNDYAQFVMLGE